ncbi:MAG TPA: hypothetical protein VHO25_18460 [Polyangiaceae bacterium]|nr:hypothetical protein [Polyangiaceae bacterium]
MSDPLFEALWQKLEQNWDDSGAHERFLNHCLETRQLASAAARYRTVAGRDTSLQLQRISALALSQLAASRTPHSVVMRNAVSLLAVAITLSLSIALLLLALR